MLRWWSGYRNKLLRPLHRSVISAPLNKMCVCQFLPTVRQQRNVQEILGTQIVERIQKQIVETVPQERDQRTVEQNVCVSIPTVQEPMLGQGIPELQVVELLERVQRRADKQSEKLIERLKEFDKRLEMNEARRAENNELMNGLIKEIGVLWEERKQPEWLSGGSDVQQNLRESSKKKKKRNLNRSVQVMEQIPEHPVTPSDQEG